MLLGRPLPMGSSPTILILCSVSHAFVTVQIRNHGDTPCVPLNHSCSLSLLPCPPMLLLQRTSLSGPPALPSLKRSKPSRKPPACLQRSKGQSLINTEEAVAWRQALNWRGQLARMVPTAFMTGSIVTTEPASMCISQPSAPLHY